LLCPPRQKDSTNLPGSGRGNFHKNQQLKNSPIKRLGARLGGVPGYLVEKENREKDGDLKSYR
jgi:hypothetical protein